MLNEIEGSLPISCLLPRHYMLEAESETTICECGGRLRTQWTETRYPIGLAIGEPKLVHRVKQCPACKATFRSDEISRFVPFGCRYAFDIISKAGLGRYRDYRQNREIQQDIYLRYRLKIPCSTISNLAGYFIDYLSGAHYSAAGEIGALLNRCGGYVLHADGTCEAGTDTIFAMIDGKTSLVIDASKMASENLSDLELLFRQTKNLFGDPLAVMRDLSNRITRAKENVIPDAKDFVCHYHFLENVGKRLCRDNHGKLTACLKKFKIRSSLRSLRQDLVRYSKLADSAISEEEITGFLDNPREMQHLDPIQLRRYLTYILLRWLADYPAELKGEFFPFDLPGLVFYRRCTKLYDRLQKTLGDSQSQVYGLPTLKTALKKLAPVREDKELVETAQRLEKAEEIFTALRKALRFENQGHKPLSRRNEPKMVVSAALKMEKRLGAFKGRLLKVVKDEQDSDRVANARLVLRYLEKYWDQLFGHVIDVEGQQEPLLAMRTNYIPEHRFGNSKQGMRRKLGTKKLIRSVQAMRPEELFVPNLNNQDYLNIISGGQLSNLPACFARNYQAGFAIRRDREKKKSKVPMALSKKKLRNPNLLSNVENGIKIYFKMIENHAHAG